MQLRATALALLLSTTACVATPVPASQGLRIKVATQLTDDLGGAVSVRMNTTERVSRQYSPEAETLVLGTPKHIQQVEVMRRYLGKTERAVLPVFVPANGWVELRLELGDQGSNGELVPHLTATKVDLRSEITKRGMAIRNQGPRGTCSVFAMTFLLEYQYAHMFGSEFADLSEQYLNYQAHVAVGGSAESHGDGGFFWMVSDAFEQYGACPETNLPYKAAFNFAADTEALTLEVIATARDKRREAIDEHGLESFYIKPNGKRNELNAVEFQAIKDALRLGLPVAMGRGHSVVLVGYDDEAQEFLYRNSYGPKFGDAGYGTYSYEDIGTNCYDLFVNWDAAVVPFVDVLKATK